jgi:hypothetical protein
LFNFEKTRINMTDTLKTPMSQAQMLVLQVVKEQYNEQDLAELRQLLIDFNSRKMQQHLDKTVAEKGYTAHEFEQMLKGHAHKTH